ncbi:MAG: hypothetical protein QM655_02895 [Nocardioidaceae bacterium]
MRKALGHSFGGLVVQQYGLDHPDEIDQLVISYSMYCLDHLDQSMEMAREFCDSDEQHRVLSEDLLSPSSLRGSTGGQRYIDTRRRIG